MPDLEKFFRVNINICSMQPDKTVNPVYKSRELYKTNNKPDTMILNLYYNHLSYVTRFHTYAKKIECLMCGRLFSRLSDLKAHDRICNKMTTLKFPGGFYSPPKTIFEKLSEIGITVDKALQHYPWMVVYDMEAIFSQIEMAMRSFDKLERKWGIGSAQDGDDSTTKLRIRVRKPML